MNLVNKSIPHNKIGTPILYVTNLDLILFVCFVVADFLLELVLINPGKVLN